MKTLAMLAMVVVCLGRVRAADAVVTGSIFGPVGAKLKSRILSRMERTFMVFLFRD